MIPLIDSFRQFHFALELPFGAPVEPSDTHVSFPVGSSLTWGVFYLSFSLLKKKLEREQDVAKTITINTFKRHFFSPLPFLLTLIFKLRNYKVNEFETSFQTYITLSKQINCLCLNKVFLVFLALAGFAAFTYITTNELKKSRSSFQSADPNRSIWLVEVSWTPKI